MATNYETGSKTKVLKMMVQHAIQDREVLLESYAHCAYEYAEVISEIETEIRDYKKFRRTLK